ncbi:uncharacterized protein Bfra_009171 [Botrytis fragariae]|uniref:Uncharacterized protein n=1 Tax=Botrytis fragariae TaxID=1964551 RepID=A0A8H6ANH1_9HELO|nr:uncharacterized protein Bfra_009171 [Botrytis fragariae]KAF5870624.1 hypothetical protein Bfra_009171 [Botrytis fragariae]
MADNTFIPVSDAIKQKLSEGRILEPYTFAEIDRTLPSRFLRGSDWIFQPLSITPPSMLEQTSNVLKDA